ncbi:L,D-transpeptidase family protein [Bradyrhizobium sp. ISRA443]|uniref:L,D-transpeptidase n=1 Tax=unclassified Bradyrhizobium TaxID=2631580 RepID=UPI00247B0E15|nr:MULTISPECIES: L,D-transpeptidase [unclassified Bradyrhizobium]WGS00788.1 L,D-transpeptidase family protein [Bradyrhizobium sp. ISRA436]WGS07675.1 L,D-transpeptidase family protein [Bradyrhizobium sp. ISRA437]WGS14563.1 L,D-transpeptidase family protein [Bradyrhizobium sp. ISRA443]
MMINRILTICAAAALGVAGTSFAHAQQGYPAPQGPAYSAAPQPYSPGNMPNFDSLDDDDAPQNSASLPPPGPVMSPDDPRYGRPMNAQPAYSDRAPSGPVMSPDDPRYGRPMGPPPVIYADRPQGGSQQQQAYGDGGVPAANVVYPANPNGNDRNGMRPPGAVNAAGVTGTVPPQSPPIGADGKPVQIAALPPDEQPEDGPAQLAPNLRRQEVAFQTKEPPGTIVVDTPHTYLYYVLGNGRAIRYGVRVGRDGFTWTGVQKITRKAEWPDWHPPPEMIERQPYLPRFMAGGPGNPLGARAMYLGSTVYRIHGTNQPSTIGKFVSSGCIGMLNEDVSDLFDRVKVGTRVVVWPGNPPAGTATASAAPTPDSTSVAAAAPQAQAAPLPGTQPTSVQPLPAPVTVR